MTKKNYQAPKLELEEFQLDANIASNCGIVVHNGPAMGSHSQCEDYQDPFAMSNGISLFSVPHNVQFYEDTCDCYTSGGDYGYWTS